MQSPEHAAELRGKRVVFTGRMASMSRVAAVVWAAQQGAIVQRHVGRRTDWVVVGSDGWPLRKSGKLTVHLSRAERLQEAGCAIQVVSEASFLKALGVQQWQAERDGLVRRDHTLEQLSRMLGISGLRIRRWVDRGLIHPIDPEAAVLRFDFLEVSLAKRLMSLLRRERKLSVVVDSLKRLRRWLGQEARLSDHLIEYAGRLAVRDEQGTLVDANGQQMFCFDQAEPIDAVVASSPVNQRSESWTWDADLLFDRAYGYTQYAQFAEAAEAYRQWIERFGEDAQVLFNLGNAYNELSDYERAIGAYRQSLEVDADQPRVWNNLGLALAQVNQIEAAIDAMRKAIEHDPTYAAAYYNLADLYDEAGRLELARKYWQEYLRRERKGEAAEYARERLAEVVTQ